MFIFSNLATSLDGKIATVDQSLFHLGTAADRRQMQVLRRRCDAVLMGASTLRTYRGACTVRGAKRQPVNVVLSSGLDGISPAWPFFKDKTISRVLIVSGKVSRDRLKSFELSSTIIRVRGGAPAILRALKKLGVRRLLLEGGGGVMWEFAKRNLIDELHVTLTPRILGGARAPTLVDGEGFKPSRVLNLKLARVRRLGDELYLTYRKTNRRG